MVVQAEFSAADLAAGRRVDPVVAPAAPWVEAREEVPAARRVAAVLADLVTAPIQVLAAALALAAPRAHPALRAVFRPTLRLRIPAPSRDLLREAAIKENPPLAPGR